MKTNEAKTIKYAGIEWVVLEENERGYFCLSKEHLFEKAFDISCYNNWSKSSLREYLNGEWFDSLPEKDAFLPFEIDLTSDDGLKDYGVSTDKIGLITCDQYRKYRYIIGTKDTWWWTATPRTCSPGASHAAGGSTTRYVNPDGTVQNNYSARGIIGVAPACFLDKSVICNLNIGESKK